MNSREIYVFYDTVSGQYGEPFTMANAAEVRRYFDSIVANPAVPPYAVNDTLVLHLGTLVLNDANPQIIPARVVDTVVRGGSYNVEKIRGEGRNLDAASSELHSAEVC